MIFSKRKKEKNARSCPPGLFRQFDRASVSVARRHFIALEHMLSSASDSVFFFADISRRFQPLDFNSLRLSSLNVSHKCSSPSSGSLSGSKDIFSTSSLCNLKFFAFTG